MSGEYPEQSLNGSVMADATAMYENRMPCAAGCCPRSVSMAYELMQC